MNRRTEQSTAEDQLRTGVNTRTPADHPRRATLISVPKPRSAFGVRLLSLLIDYGVILAYLAVLVLVALGSYALTGTLHDWLSLGTAGAELLGFVVLMLPVGVYLYLCEASERQATVGKASAESAGGGCCYRRTALQATCSGAHERQVVALEVAHFIVWQTVAFTATGATDFPAWPSVGIVVANVLPIPYVGMVLFQRDRRGPHDLMARSKVIRIRGGAAGDVTVDGLAGARNR